MARARFASATIAGRRAFPVAGSVRGAALVVTGKWLNPRWLRVARGPLRFPRKTHMEKWCDFGEGVALPPTPYPKWAHPPAGVMPTRTLLPHARTLYARAGLAQQPGRASTGRPYRITSPQTHQDAPSRTPSRPAGLMAERRGEASNARLVDAAPPVIVFVVAPNLGMTGAPADKPAHGSASVTRRH